MRPNEMSRRIRFGPYEADFHTQELRKHGVKLKLSGQPLQVLEVLLARPGQLVVRAELEQLLWPGQVFIDSSHGLNAAVNKLREALSDSASEPKYIETLPRRGYRFIGSIETCTEQPPMTMAEPPGTGDASGPREEKHEARAAETFPADISQRAGRNWVTLSATVTILLCVIGLMAGGARQWNRGGNLARQQEAAAEKAAVTVSPQQEHSRTPLAASVVQAVASEAAELRRKLSEKVERSPAADRKRNTESSGAGDDDPAAESTEKQPALRLRRVIWGDGGNAGPQFSPDGKRIAFMSNREGAWEIWVSEVDGSHPRQVSFTDSAGTPRWSPDGKSIAFDAPFDGSTWIFVVRLDQSQRAQPIIEGLVPSFSRDGKWIYFASEQTGDWQVWKTSLDGSEVQVTFHGGFAALESTDGYIYYSKSRYSQPEMCRIRVKGGEESCDIEHLRPRTWASWAPTREGIVFAEDMPNGKAALSLYDPARRQVRDLVLLQSAPFWVGASIDGRRAIMNDAAEQQISMVDHLH